MGNQKRSLSGSLLCYAIGIAGVIAAFLTRQVLVGIVGGNLPTYLTFYPAVTLVAILCGFGPGLFATVMASLITTYWILPPLRHFGITHKYDVVGLVVFTGMGILISLVAEHYRRARQKAAAYETERALSESRKDLSRAQAVAHVGSWRIDLERNEMSGSDEAGRIFGIPKETHITYETFLAIVHPYDREYVDKMWTVALGGEPYDIEYRIVVEGKVKWVRARAEMESDPQGMLRAGFGTIQDVTERKQTEEALRESEKKYRELAEMLPQNVFETDLEGNLVFGNRSGLDMFGYTQADLERGLNVVQMIVPEEREDAAENLQRSIRGEKGTRNEYNVKRKDGSTFPVMIYGNPIIRDGRPVGLRGILVDISERKEAEKTVLRSEEESRRLAQEISTVAEIGRIVSSTLKIDEVYDRFAKEVHKLIPIDMVSVNTIDEEKGIAIFLHAAGIVVKGRQRGDAFPVAGSASAEILRTRCGAIIEMDEGGEFRNRYPALSTAFESGLRSVMIVPLISKDKIIGAVNFFSLQPQVYTGRDLRLAESVAAQIAGAIANAELFVKRQQAEEALRKSEEKFRELYNDAPVGYLEYDTEGRITNVNRTGLEMLGYSLEEMLEKPVWDLSIDEELSRQQILTRLSGTLPPGRNLERTYRRKDGSLFPVFVGDRAILDENGEVVGIRAAIQDATQLNQAEREKEYLQEQLSQAQKMEAIGTLAGGIAHDFNNILSAILGYAELAQFEIEANSKAKYDLDQSMKAARRAKDLVQQILTFSRQQKKERKPLHIEPIIKEGLKFLRASLPATIEIRQKIEEDVKAIEADPTEVHQVLINLCTNAAHAMGENGGILEVYLSNLNIDGGNPAVSRGMNPGPYVQLRVTDTGHGISPEIMKRIFDPYFTTKEVGKGTGLGLSVVHGIVKGYGGGIEVASEVGKGSAFSVFFPKIEAANIPADAHKDEPLPLGAKERILFVDDEEAIAEIGRKILGYLGYEAVTRTSSIEALELFRANPDRFDLVITDMTMPNMRGDKLAQELMRIRPDLPIILCTGFSELISEEKAKAMGIREFVMKPLVMIDLGHAIRSALDHKKDKVT